MKSIILTILMIGALSISAQTSGSTDYFNVNGLAINGYDPVSYLVSNKAEKGIESIKFSWSGVIWHFSSETNKKLFKDSPEKYAPQYGGYCAYGWAKGYAAKIDPEAWSIENGKLYLNYNSKVQQNWNKDKIVYISAANENYARSKTIKKTNK